jgi:hypothetical protein
MQKVSLNVDGYLRVNRFEKVEALMKHYGIEMGDNEGNQTYLIDSTLKYIESSGDMTIEQLENKYGDIDFIMDFIYFSGEK